LLRRFFELRPPAFRRLAGQTRVGCRRRGSQAAEQQAGFEGSDRIYVERMKKRARRSGGVPCRHQWIDGRQLDGGRRVIDVEGLVLLCEALDAVGDQYALYAYSGRGRELSRSNDQGFDERLGTTTAQRLGGLSTSTKPGRGGDPSCRRHVEATGCENASLVLLSDGRPLDGEYRMVRAGRTFKSRVAGSQTGGHPSFCVTIDRNADGYMRRMYGDVSTP
jgi:nitric oxide reductase activation protein